MSREIKQVAATEFLSLNTLRDSNIDESVTYDFVHETKCNGRKIAILPFDLNELNIPEYFYLMDEYVPCWGSSSRLVSITGSVELSSPTIEAVCEELQEESGFHLPSDSDRIIPLGYCFSSKMLSSHFELYAIDVTGLSAAAAKTDGSVLESLSTCNRIHRDKFNLCVDPLAYVMRSRLLDKISR